MSGLTRQRALELHREAVSAVEAAQKVHAEAQRRDDLLAGMVERVAKDLKDTRDGQAIALQAVVTEVNTFTTMRFWPRLRWLLTGRTDV
jgi:hypothetical protein